MKKNEHNPIINLQLYQGNKVQIATLDRRLVEGIMFPAEEGKIEVRTETGCEKLEISVIADIKYVGRITDYHTSGDSATLDDVIGFTLSDIADNELFEKMKYKEFDCTACCHLYFNAADGRIEACDVTLKEAVHVINSILLGKEYLYKLYGEMKWKLGVLQKQEEQYVLLGKDGTETGIAEADIADITKMPVVNDHVEIKVADGSVYSGVVNAVHKDRVFLVEKNMGQLASHMVLFEEMEELRFAGKIMMTTDRITKRESYSIDRKYNFKNPQYLREGSIAGTIGRKASFYVGINATGMIAKDVVVTREMGKIHTGIVLNGSMSDTSSSKTGFIGDTLGKIRRKKGNVLYNTDLLKEWMSRNGVDYNYDRDKTYLIVQYTITDENATPKWCASIENCVPCSFGKNDATIKVKDTAGDEEIQREIIPLMLEKKQYYEGKDVDVKYRDEKGATVLYSGIYEESTLKGAKLQGRDSIIPWDVIEEVRLYGEITNYNQISGDGKINGEFFHHDDCSGFNPVLGAAVSYEVEISRAMDAKGEAYLLRFVRIKSSERRQGVYIVNRVDNVYSYIEEEEYLSGNRDNVKQVTTHAACYLPDIKENDYPAEFIWQRENGKEIVEKIELLQGTVSKEKKVVVVPKLEGKKYSAKNIPSWVTVKEGTVKEYIDEKGQKSIRLVDNTDDKIMIPFHKYQHENFCKSCGLDFELDFETFDYKVKYGEGTGKSKGKLFLYEFEEIYKTSSSAAAENSRSVGNGIVGDVTQGIVAPVFMEGENVFIVKDYGEEREERIFGTVSRIVEKDVYVREGKDDREIRIDMDKDRIHRFGLLTKVNKDMTEACLSGITRFSFDAMDKPTQGSVKTAKKKRMLAYYSREDRIVEVSRASCNIDNAIGGSTKEEKCYKAVDYIPWKSGEVVDYLQNEEAVIIHLPEQTVKYYLTQDKSPLIKKLMDRGEIINKEIYVKTVAYPCKNGNKEELIFDAIEIYPKEEYLEIQYNDKRERWEALIHGTLKAELSGEEEYLNSKAGSIVKVCFIPDENDGAVLRAVVDGKIKEKLSSQLAELEASLGGGEEAVIDEFSYIMSILAKGKENGELYRYRLFLTDFYQGHALVEKYEESKGESFEGNEALKRLFSLGNCQVEKLNVRNFVRHMVSLDDMNFKWLMDNSGLSDNDKLAETISSTMKAKNMDAVFNGESINGNLYEVIRTYYGKSVDTLRNELSVAGDCEGIVECINSYLWEDNSALHQYFMWKSEEKQLSEVKAWCLEVSRGCNDVNQRKEHESFLEKLGRLGESPRFIVKELLLGRIDREDAKNVLLLIENEIDYNIRSFLEKKPPVLSCGIPGDQLVVGQKKVEFYVQNYSEKSLMLQPARNIKIRLELYMADKETQIAEKEYTTVKMLSGSRGENNVQTLEGFPVIDYNVYGKDTELEMRVTMSYQAGDSSKLEKKTQNTKIRIVKRMEIPEESPYPEKNETKENFFFGRVEESEKINKAIFKRDRAGNICSMNPGSRVYIYGQKQCGKTYLTEQFFDKAVLKMRNGKEYWEDSRVLYFGEIASELRASMPLKFETTEVDEGEAEEVATEKRRIAHEKQEVRFYRNQLRCLIMKRIKDDFLEKDQKQETKVSKLGLKKSAKWVDGEKNVISSNAKITLPQEEKYDVLRNEVPKWENADDAIFMKFISAFKEISHCTPVLILDEFTDYCGALKGMLYENIKDGLDFMTEFDKLGFVQIFIGHEGMYILLKDMGMANKTATKYEILKLLELEKEDALTMIRQPMMDTLGYNPYNTVLGEQAEEELLRLSGRNPKILSVMCNIMYKYLKDASVESGKMFLTKEDVREAMRAAEDKGRVHKDSLFEALLGENTDHPEMRAEVIKCLKELTEADNNKQVHHCEIMVSVDDKQKSKIDLIQRLRDRNVIGRLDGKYYIKVGWFAEYIEAL